MQDLGFGIVMVEKYLNQIIQGDCLEVLREIPDNSVDVTFADPPFNLQKKYNSSKDSLDLEEYLDWCKLWINEMVRITKPTGSVFVHNIPKWLTYYTAILNQSAQFKHWITWDAPTSRMGKSLQPSHLNSVRVLPLYRKVSGMGNYGQHLDFLHTVLFVQELHRHS